MPCCLANASILAYLDRLAVDLFWTSWSSVKTGCEVRWMDDSDSDANLRG